MVRDMSRLTTTDYILVFLGIILLFAGMVFKLNFLTPVGGVLVALYIIKGIAIQVVKDSHKK